MSLGLNLGLPGLRFSASAAAISAAATLASGEADALSFDFTDDYFQATTGFYGSAYIKDTGTPANDYDSSPVTGTDSPLLTNTAPSLKMTMGPSGTLRFQAHNLMLHSEDITQSGWTVDGTGTKDTATTFTFVTQNAILYRTVTGLAVGQTFTYDVWIRNISGNANIKLWHNNATIPTTTAISITSTLTKYTVNLTTTATNMTIGVRDENASGLGQIEVTKFHLRRTPSESVYLKTTTAPRYALPLDWDSAGNPLGLLVEEARTNLCLYSDDLTKTSNWTPIGVTTSKTATGPDGVANSATTVTATSNNGAVGQQFILSSAARSGRFMLKRRTGTGAVKVSLGNVTGSDLVSTQPVAANWYSSTGSHTFTDDAGQVKIECTSDGVAQVALNTASGLSSNPTVGQAYQVTWQIRVDSGDSVGTVAQNAVPTYTETITNTSLVTVTRTFVNAGVLVRVNGMSAGEIAWVTNITVRECEMHTIDLSSGGWVDAKIENVTNVNPSLMLALATSGDAVDVALAGVETGAFVTSPIPTLASTVTRAADNISLATSAFPFDASAGTVYAQIVPPVNNSTGRVWQLAQAASDSSHQIAVLGNEAWVYSGGVQYASFTNVVTSTKTAFAFASNDANFSKDGDIGTDDTSVTMPSGVDKLTIGTKSSGGGVTNWCSCHIKQLMYLPRRMSNADMVTLTSG